MSMTDFYDRHFRAYHDETVAIDPEPFLGPFARHLRPGDHVLDVGCGSGRDIRWLRHKGMRVTGFERSAGLAVLARRHAGCDIIEGDFNTYDFQALSVDAILLCGALVHVPHHDLASVMANILRALDPDSPRRIVYLSLKEGRGADVDDRGRMFYFWQDDALRSVFASRDMRILDWQRSSAADGGGNVWLGYVLRHRRHHVDSGF